MTNTDMLRDTISRKGLKYQYLASEMGLSTFGLQKKIENITEFKASEIVKLSALLALNMQQREDIFFWSESD